MARNTSAPTCGWVLITANSASVRVPILLRMRSWMNSLPTSCTRPAKVTSSTSCCGEVESARDNSRIVTALLAMSGGVVLSEFGGARQGFDGLNHGLAVGVHLRVRTACAASRPVLPGAPGRCAHAAEILRCSADTSWRCTAEPSPKASEVETWFPPACLDTYMPASATRIRSSMENP